MWTYQEWRRYWQNESYGKVVTTNGYELHKAYKEYRRHRRMFRTMFGAA